MYMAITAVHTDGMSALERQDRGVYPTAFPLATLLPADSEEGSLYHPWIDRLTHHACQDMSSQIPYPAVFNSCKTGYR